MTLGIFFAMGDSFTNMAKVGQDELFKKFYLSYFAKNFDQVYIFSYANEKVSNLPSNTHLIPNKLRFHRYLYGLLMPFLNFSYILKCDVFRTYHLLGTPPAIVGRLFFARPFVFNFAYDYEKFAKIDGQYFQWLFFKLIRSLALVFASKIFAANREIFKKLPYKKTVYLPNGVDVNFFKPHHSVILRRKSTKDLKKPIILSVGRLEKQKNFENLIFAMKGLNAKLLIVGRGSLKEKLKNLAEKNNVNLKIIEKVPHTKMPRIYNQADIFVLPSFAEGSPKVLLEAMACGIACIASSVQGTKEIIVDSYNGLANSTQPIDMRDRLERLIINVSLRKKLGQNARKTIIDDFNLNILIKKEINILKSN